MKHKLFILSIVLVLTSVTLFITACTALKSEFLGTPPAGTVITNAALQTTQPPPITGQLQAAAQIAQEAAPAPYGSLIAAALNGAATLAAAFAAFHARSAAASSATAATASAGNAPAAAPVQKT